MIKESCRRFHLRTYISSNPRSGNFAVLRFCLEREMSVRARTAKSFDLLEASKETFIGLNVIL